MTMQSLLALSPLDGRYSQKLHALRPIFSEYGLIKFRFTVEIRWLQMLAEYANIYELPPLSRQAKHSLNALVDNFSEKDAERIKQIESETNHDVKAVEYFIKECTVNYPDLAKISEFIHFGCTSEDINNLAYALMLQTARKQCLLPALAEIQSLLKTQAHQYANLPMLARTHGQPASPTTVGKELANFHARLDQQITQLNAALILGKMNGATGNYSAFHAAAPNTDWQELSNNFVMKLGLEWNPFTTQIEPHDYLAEFFMILMRINTILIDLNRDIWGYIALDYFRLAAIKTEVGSSTMPHKVNPIDFENAEGNLGLANALLGHMADKLPISRWQRDLSDSTVLRNIGVALGYALLAYQSTAKGLAKITPDKDCIAADLDNHWEVLAEPIQTVMRRYGIEQPYEKLKAFTRGKKVNKTILHQFIESLEVPFEIKKQLLRLTPHNYLGYAEELAKRV